MTLNALMSNSDVFDYISQGPKIAKAVNDARATYRGIRGARRGPPAIQRSYNYSTQSQINQLRRAINRNTQELQTYRREAVAYTRTGSGVEETIDISLTDLIIADTNFRENVLGDKFRMKYVGLNMSTNVDRLRVILYKPKDAGQSINSALLTNALQDFIEPSSFTVLHDRVINVQNTNRADKFHFSLAKRLNFLTTINSQASDVIKTGDLRLMVITQGTSISDVGLSVMMKFQNK